MKKLIFLVFILISCSIKKTIDCQPIQKIDQNVPKDTLQKDTIKKVTPIPPNPKTYKYMKRIIYRNNPVA